MTTGCAIYLSVCSAPNPQKAVSDLGSADLAALHDHVARLPKEGVPGVITAAVTVEAAGRWFKHCHAGGLQ